MFARRLDTRFAHRGQITRVRLGYISTELDATLVSVFIATGVLENLFSLSARRLARKLFCNTAGKEKTSRRSLSRQTRHPFSSPLFVRRLFAKVESPGVIDDSS